MIPWFFAHGHGNGTWRKYVALQERNKVPLNGMAMNFYRLFLPGVCDCGVPDGTCQRCCTVVYVVT